jgi:hypothetical protein
MLEVDVEDAQELARTLRTLVRRIDWTLENNPPKKETDKVDLDARAKQLTIIASDVEAALHKRALEAK